MKNTLIVIFVLCSKLIQGQNYIDVFTGYGFDAREKQNLSMINVGLQFTVSKKSLYEFSVGVVHGLGIKRKTIDSAFTSNPSLPIFSATPKSTNAVFTGIYTNHRLKLFKPNVNSHLNANFILGLRFQKVVVDYKLKHGDYVILNPDIGADRIGLYAGLGLEYMYYLKKGRLFLQANIVTPSIRRQSEYAGSYNQAVPLSLNLGYGLQLKKKEN